MIGSVTSLKAWVLSSCQFCLLQGIHFFHVYLNDWKVDGAALGITARYDIAQLKMRKVKVKSPSRVRLFATPWTVAYQAPPSRGFSRQEYWSGLPFPSPEDLPDPGIKPRSPALKADALTSEPPGKIQ